VVSETVRISGSARKLLEELRARIVLETGKRITLQDIVDAAIHLASRRRDELLRELGLWRPLSRREAEKLLDEHTIGLEVDDVERDMREVLYAEHTG